MADEDLEKFESDVELKIYREYRDVLSMFRYVIETEDWQLRPITDETAGPVALAVGLGAIHLGDLEVAKKAERRLETLAARQIEDRSTFARGQSPSAVRKAEAWPPAIVLPL